MSKLNNILFVGIFVWCSIQHEFVDGAVNIDQFLSLTLREKVALDKFRSMVEPLLQQNYMKQDIYLIRWLRSAKLDINAADKSLRESLKWRRENKIDTIQQEDWSDMASDFHMTVDTHDKNGQPIGVCDIYDWDIRRAVLQGKGQRLLRFVINLTENLTSQTTEKMEKGLNVTHFNILINADGANVIQQACPICLPLWIQFVQVMDTYYPKYLNEFIVIDSPPAVNVVLETIRPFLTKDARESIKAFGPNKSQWMAYLDKIISRDQRRQRYGGTKPPFQY